MSGSDRDLVLAIRAELAAIDPPRPCDRRAEAIALLDVEPPRGGPLARLLLRLGPERGAAEASAIAAGRGTIRSFDWAASPEHCRLAWLRGLFLAHGSLSISGGRTHLEFVVDAADAAVLRDRLADAGLPASSRIRRGRGVVTWKNGDRVGNFLRRIGATGALLELEARQVSRALRGELNRVLNAESANLHRAVGAAGRQIAAIDELALTGELAVQPHLVRAVADARRETPEATFAELAERLGIHRSAVQRALDRIERLALAAADEPGRGRAGGRRRSGRGRAGSGIIGPCAPS